MPGLMGENNVCVCVRALKKKEGNYVGNYYEITQAKHLCLTEQ